MLEAIAAAGRGQALPGVSESLLALQAAAARRARSAQFPDACEELVLRDGETVGALVTARTPGVLHLVDIALLARWRGAGIGTVVLGHLFEVADAEGTTIRASVYRTNPRAHALYRRLGFVDVGADELLYTIERTPSAR
ncbi:MAG: GNAT family N-acetyltransferase [Solirubrobacteraceae bacterium]